MLTWHGSGTSSIFSKLPFELLVISSNGFSVVSRSKGRFVTAASAYRALDRVLECTAALGITRTPEAAW